MQWNIELSADKPMIFFKADHTPAWLVRGACMVKHSALLKIKLIDRLEQKNWSNSLCLETISSLCFLCVTFWALFPCWRWNTERASSEANGCFSTESRRPCLGQILLPMGPGSPVTLGQSPITALQIQSCHGGSRAYPGYCRITNSKTCPGLPLAAAPTGAGGAAWQDGLCLLSLSPIMISLLAKAAKGWSNACWGKYANVSFLSFNQR